MFARFLAPVLFCSLMVCHHVAAQNPSQQGRVPVVGGDAGPPPGSEGDDFALAAEFDSAGSSNSALTYYRRFIKNHPASPLASKAQFRIAEILESQGNLTKAFDAYQTLVSRYPDTEHFETAVAQQVIIANSYLNGKRLNVLGIPLIPGAERAQSMYESILKNAPYSKHAAVAQFNLGLSFEKQGKIREAQNAYQSVMDRYPNSSVSDDALYQIAYIYMRSGLTGRSEDLSALVLAKETFEDFLLQYPNSEKVAQAQDNLKIIGQNEAGDLLSIAKYYDRFRNYKAAAIYYNDVVRRQPGTPEAEEASTRLQVLRGDQGEDALRVGTDRAETGERSALRRRLQAQIESSALSDYSGPPRRDIVPDELPVARAPRLRTNVRDVQPLPAIEPALPTE